MSTRHWNTYKWAKETKRQHYRNLLIKSEGPILKVLPFRVREMAKT